MFSDFGSQRARKFFLLIPDFCRPFAMSYLVSQKRVTQACLHADEGPLDGEVTHLAVVEEKPAYTCHLTISGFRVKFLEVAVAYGVPYRTIFYSNKYLR